MNLDLEDWQLRVIEEKKELENKLSKLLDFLQENENPESEAISLLVEQSEIMTGYINILEIRIDNFG